MNEPNRVTAEPGQVGPDEPVRRRDVPTDDVRLPDPVVRLTPVERIDLDLMTTASELAFFWTGSTSVAAQRSIYYRFQKKHLLGAFKYCGTIAARKSTTLALIWAEETKGRENQLVDLAALNLQLQELAASLADTEREIAALEMLLDATRTAIETVLVIKNPPPGC